VRSAGCLRRALAAKYLLSTIDCGRGKGQAPAPGGGKLPENRAGKIVANRKGPCL
jgi:hypothetical protein